MRRPQRFERGRGAIDIAMTPMIDVVFLLMIFFVCTASFEPPEESLPTPLAGQGQGQVGPPIDAELAELEEIVLHLGWQADAPTWHLSERGYSGMVELRPDLARLAGLNAALPVVLEVAPQVPLGYVIDLYDTCREVGLRKIQFAAHASEEGA